MKYLTLAFIASLFLPAYLMAGLQTEIITIKKDDELFKEFGFVVSIKTDDSNKDEVTVQFDAKNYPGDLDLFHQEEGWLGFDFKKDKDKKTVSFKLERKALQDNQFSIGFAPMVNCGGTIYFLPLKDFYTSD